MKTLSAIWLIFICIFSLPLSGQNSTKGSTTPTATRIIEIIIKNTGAAPIPNTVDVIKEGDPETLVKGIVTCMFATMDVLKQAVDKNCNLMALNPEWLQNLAGKIMLSMVKPINLSYRKLI